MATGRCFGMMVLSTRANGWMASNTGKVYYIWLTVESKKEFLRRIGLYKDKR